MLTVVSCSLVGVLYNAMVAWSPGVWLQCTHCTGGTNSSVQTLAQRRPPGSPRPTICVVVMSERVLLQDLSDYSR